MPFGGVAFTVIMGLIIGVGFHTKPMDLLIAGLACVMISFFVWIIVQKQKAFVVSFLLFSASYGFARWLQ